MPTVQEVVARVNQLSTRWAGRSRSVRKWYNILRLDNDLYQPKMESVISNDPRTGFNMALYLLHPKTFSFVVDTDGMSDDQSLHVGVLENFADRQFINLIKSSRGTLYGNPLRRVLALMLATGWYCVMAYPSGESEWSLSVWNPISVYPEYDAEGNLVEVGRIYQITADEANRKVIRENWTAPSMPFTGNPRVYNWWRLVNTEWGLRATHTVVIGNHLAKPEEVTPFPYIPIFTGPVAGLPDDGSIMTGLQWRSEIGQAILAPVADIQKNYDKTLTYMQQLLRDVSNPRFQGQMRGTHINTDDFYNRGAYFELEEGESIQAIDSVPIPPEVRAHLFDLRAQVQRGTFSDAAFGAAAISAYAMSQVTASSKQVLEPFQDGLKGLLGAIVTKNFSFMRWYNQQYGQTFNLGGQQFPSLPDTLWVDFKYDIQIPGDFLNRANSARVLNPNFRLSFTTLINNLFPEVRDPLEEKRLQFTEDAVDSPEFRAVQQIEEFLQAAAEARKLGDIKFAERLEKMALRVEAGVFREQMTQGQVTGAPRSEGMPPELQTLLRGA